MPNERKYRILTMLTLVLTFFLLGNCFREPFRLRAAEKRQRGEYVLKGAAVYAEQCVQCHGPRGEGVVGMPLNRSELKVDDRSPAGAPLYEKIYSAVDQGRPGTVDHPLWSRTPDGKWISYTAMAAWGSSSGGPLSEEDLRAVTLFVMNPAGDQWSLIGDVDLAPLPPPDYSVGADGLLPLPDAQGVDKATDDAAKGLLRNRTHTQCLNCHFVGTRGAKLAPDLTQVGSWGIDREFLERFITYANLPLPNEQDRYVVPHDERMPAYWSENRAVTGPALNLAKPVASEGPYFMLRFREKFTEEEVSTLATYLLGLK
ncbi:MAG TPA: c-type cytochrome [Symbiobacteriaceae bacterium]|nr:c-type cytochrome [Symbiobacteriaceae bacterium]